MILNVPSELRKIFLSALASTDPKFPASEWDHIIAQAVLTVNTLHDQR